MLKQLPQPDIVRSVELLDHPSPWDLKKTYDNKYEFISRADGDITGRGRIRIYDSLSNDPVELQQTMSHEWAHLLEDGAAFRAFGYAAELERDGFFARRYARTNDHENWAVHLGERFLNAEGSVFAELPEKAPARTLVMAKALRNTLEERKDNLSPKQQEFLARIHAANRDLVNKVETMDATEFGAHSPEIHDESLALLLRRENTPDFIAANPRRVTDAERLLLDAAGEQLESL
ncbi:MAG: hypothetical protein P4L53_26435 [Candidatus Obscuribacterales bacterium]|nr:hypothetical protein [Candidatus Obscuribacterales bacterium]